MDNEQKNIRIDRLRYEKNKLSAILCYGAILFNALYFISLYSVLEPTASKYYYYMMGISVVYNLIFMLAAFLSSEGVKNYKMAYAIVMIVIGVLQIARIFVWPMEALNTSPLLSILEPISKDITSLISSNAMSTSQFIYLFFCLFVSSVMSIIGGVFGIIRTCQLKAHLGSMKNDTVKE